MNPTEPQPQPTQTPQPTQQPPYQQMPPTSHDSGPLSAMQTGETVIFTLQRHPIGIIGIYVSFAVLLAFVGAAAITAPELLTDYDSRMVSNIGLAVFVASAALAFLFSYIARTIYYGNRWILTSDSLTQINQNSLFSKQNSQLGLDNLEDVTAEQNGILAHVLNYGVLRAQTAGEHGKFQFIYCSKPNEYAQKILMARENFEHGNMYTSQTNANN